MNNNKYYFLSLFFLINLVFFSNIKAQNSKNDYQENNKYQEEETDTLTRFSYGMNLGFYFPDNHPANFYNGSPANENKLDLILRNYYYRKQLEDTLGYMIDSVNPYNLPGKMRYAAAYTVGFYVRYQLDKSLGIFASFNFVKLEAKDVFLLNLDLPPGWSLDPTYRQYPIWGKEKRVNIDLGVSKYFQLAPKSVFFFEGGMNINNTRVIENKIAINNTAYSLVNVYGNQSYIPNSQIQQYEVIQGGIGFGIFATTGVKLVFSDYISMDPGATFYWKGINLGKYDAFKPTFNLFIRFSFKKLI
ncbi:MAG: hypothetical protein AB9842_06780 [Bacteroidales bacterium]